MACRSIAGPLPVPIGNAARSDWGLWTHGGVDFSQVHAAWTKSIPDGTYTGVSDMLSSTCSVWCRCNCGHWLSMLFIACEFAQKLFVCQCN